MANNPPRYPDVSPAVLAGRQGTPEDYDRGWSVAIDFYTPRLARALRAHGLQDDAVRAVIQDVWVAAYPAMLRWRNPTLHGFLGWARTTGLRAYARQRQEEKRAGTSAGVLTDEQSIPSDEDAERLALEILAEKDFRRRVDELLKSDKHRRVVALKYDLGYSNEEIAEIMRAEFGGRTTEGTIKSDWFRICRTIRHHLAPP